jgi:hypothetical protein
VRAAVVLAAVLLWPASASAADYGGGRVSDTVITLRTNADSVVVRANLVARCGAGAVRQRVPLAPDGSFSLAATVRGRAPDDRRVRRIARLAIGGQVAGATATGTARLRLTFRRGRRVVGRCASGERRWRAGSDYHGLASFDGGRRPRAFMLDREGSAVTAAMFEYRLRCRNGTTERINVMPGGRVAADGRFELQERFTLHFEDARERFRVVVRGRFTTTGVGGRLRVSSVARSPAGRVIDRCRTGPVSFSANR